MNCKAIDEVCFMSFIAIYTSIVAVYPKVL